MNLNFWHSGAMEWALWNGSMRALRILRPVSVDATTRSESGTSSFDGYPRIKIAAIGCERNKGTDPHPISATDPFQVVTDLFAWPQSTCRALEIGLVRTCRQARRRGRRCSARALRERMRVGIRRVVNHPSVRGIADVKRVCVRGPVANARSIPARTSRAC